MKKATVILLVLALCLSLLAACGGEPEEPAAPVIEDPRPAPELTPEPTPVPIPEPVTDGMNTVEITNADYGDIIFSYPDDGSVTVIIAEPGAEDKSLIPRDEFEDLVGAIIQSHYNIEFQKALIAGDDFNILVGYTNYYDSGSYLKTFGMVERNALFFRSVPLTLDGLTGVVNTSHVASFIFPAITQYAGRVFLVFPNSVDEDDDVQELSKSLIERADILAIINTFRFPGEIPDEPRLEVQPLDNEIFSLTPTDGWEVAEMNFMWHIYKLKKGEMIIDTNSSSSTPAREKMDEFLNSVVYSDTERVDNVTINGQEFAVLYTERWEMFILFTTRGGAPLDIDSPGYFMMEIRGTNNLDDVMPVLNTLTVK